MRGHNILCLEDDLYIKLLYIKLLYIKLLRRKVNNYV